MLLLLLFLLNVVGFSEKAWLEVVNDGTQR